jgi:hypothetical protein
MEYKIIFSTGYSYDLEYVDKRLRCDVLILDEMGNYYNPQYITLERVNSEFSKDKICYLEDNLVILHRMGREAILQTIPELHRWMFFKHWVPLTSDQLIKYFYPKDQWEVIQCMSNKMHPTIPKP